MKEVLTI